MTQVLRYFTAAITNIRYLSYSVMNCDTYSKNPIIMSLNPMLNTIIYWRWNDLFEKFIQQTIKLEGQRDIAYTDYYEIKHRNRSEADGESKITKSNRDETMVLRKIVTIDLIN